MQTSSWLSVCARSDPNSQSHEESTIMIFRNRTTVLDGEEMRSGLLGKEAKHLVDAWNRIREINSKPECFLVAGTSVCGTAQHLLGGLEEMVVSSEGCYGTGKPSEESQSIPYAALADAIEQVLHSKHIQNLRKDIARELGEDGDILFNTVPSLRGEPSDDDHLAASCTNSECGNHDDARCAFFRIASRIRKLFLAITKIAPLVIVLNDIHLSQEASIDVINHVLADGEVARFLFIGTFREETASESVQSKLQTVCGSVNVIQVGDLTVMDINKFLSNYLRLDSSITAPLAEKIYKKTHGNILFVVQFMKLLGEKELLFFCFTTYTWSWDLDRISCDTDSTDNVVEALIDRLPGLPVDSQLALAVAASFGTKFPGDSLAVVMTKLSEQRLDGDDLFSKLEAVCCSNMSFNSDLDNVLEGLEKEGFLENLAEMNVYKFAHEDIKKAAHNLLALKGRDALHLQIGKAMWEQVHSMNSDTDYDGSLLMQIIEQLDLSGPLLQLEDASFKVAVARLNLEAACRVKRHGAFHTASEYTHTSSSLLGQTKWDTDYQLALEVSNVQAELAFCRGKFLECNVIVDDILSNARTMLDKLDAFIVRTNCLGAKQSVDKLLETVYDVVSHFGYSSPRARKPGNAMTARLLMKTKTELKRVSDENLMAFKECDDKDVEGCLKLLSLAVTSAWMSNEWNDFVSICCLMVKISLNKGFTKFTASGLLGFAVVIASAGDMERAQYLSSVALRVADIFQAKECDGQTLLLHTTFFQHRSSPMHNLLDFLIKSNKLAKAAGDIEHAHHACMVYTITYIACGLPLQVIANDAKELIAEMKQFECSAALTRCRLHRQLALNLMEQSNDPFKLEGEEIPSMDRLLHSSCENGNRRTHEAMLCCQLFLACYLGEGSQGKKIAVEHMKLDDREYPACYSILFPFYRCIVFFRLVRMGHRGFQRKAEREIRRIRAFVRDGFVNCTHLLYILEAEKLSLTKRATDHAVKVAYEKAVSHASRSGFPQDAGLASENCGRFFDDRRKDWSSFSFDRAVENYQQWGAHAKIALIRKQSGTISEESGQISTAIRGRARGDSFWSIQEHGTTDWHREMNANDNNSDRDNLSVAGSVSCSVSTTSRNRRSVTSTGSRAGSREGSVPRSSGSTRSGSRSGSSRSTGRRSATQFGRLPNIARRNSDGDGGLDLPGGMSGDQDFRRYQVHLRLQS